MQGRAKSQIWANFISLKFSDFYASMMSILPEENKLKFWSNQIPKNPTSSSTVEFVSLFDIYNCVVRETSIMGLSFLSTNKKDVNYGPAEQVWKI